MFSLPPACFTCARAALVQFSGEESHGQFLDLHALYEMYLNLTFVVEKITYTEYVTTFDRLAAFQPRVKNAGYRKCVHIRTP
jgi:hypothetical protein